jgi:hypothetical protein
MLGPLLALVLLAIILLGFWYIHKDWVSLKAGKGWLGTILRPFFWLWGKLFG